MQLIARQFAEAEELKRKQTFWVFGQLHFLPPWNLIAMIDELIMACAIIKCTKPNSLR